MPEEQTQALMIEQPGIIDLHLAVQQLKDAGISFDEAVVHLIRAHGLTWNAAADRLRGAEAITGIWLDGDSPKPVRPSIALGSVGAAGEKETQAHEPQAQTPEAAPQDPETLFCIICGNPIPEARARRQTATCSEKCKNRLDTIRQHQREAKKCPACLNPSTPEERKLFRIWRAERGEVSLTQVKRDRTLPNKEDMALALKRAARELRDVADTLAAQLAGDALETKAEALAIGSKVRKQAEARLERVTNLIRDCEHWATPKGRQA